MQGIKDDPLPQKENLCHDSIGSVHITSHKQNNWHCKDPGPHPLNSTPSHIEDHETDKQAALGSSDEFIMRGVSITAEQMTALSAEERALLGKLARKVPTLHTRQQPTTPMLLPNNNNKASPPSPPPPPDRKSVV